MNRLAVATGGYQSTATYARQLAATNGYWNHAIAGPVVGGTLQRWFLFFGYYSHNR